MIDTIFYFAPTKTEYESYLAGHEIDPRTVVFVADTGEIYKNGRLYGKMSKDDFTTMLNEVLLQNPYVLPKATKYTGSQSDHIGGVMGGKYITVNTENGVISIDLYELFNDPNALQLIQNIISKLYIENEYIPKVATYDRLGVVQIKQNGGILVNGGLISIDPNSNVVKTVIEGAIPKIEIRNGYWYINGENTGVEAKGQKGDKGDKGDSGTGGSSNTRYLVDIFSYYLITNSIEGVTIDTVGWTTNRLIPTEQNRYLWRKDIYKYSNGEEIVKGPYLIGSLGEKGDRGETGPGGGFDPELDIFIQEINNKVTYNYNWINGIIRGEVARVDQLVNAIDSEIKDRITNMITDTEWIQNHYAENVIGYNSGWDSELQAYLQRVGLWWKDGNGNITYRWSDLLTRIGSIEADVDTLIRDPNGTITTLQAALNLFADDTTARVTIDTFWAKMNEAKDVITWLYSGLRSEASENYTWNDLISAAKGEDGGTAAANLHLGIERTLEGKFISKGSLITELDGELREKIASGVLSQTDPNYSFASLFSDVQTNNQNYSDLRGLISTIVDVTDPLNAYVQQHMIAEATIYAVEMETKTINGKSVDVPIYYSDPSGKGLTKSANKENNIYLHYILDKDSLGRPLWIITDEDGYTYNGTTYNLGDIVTFDPGEHGEFKKIVKALNAAGFVTYAGLNEAYSRMIAEDKNNGIAAKIEAWVRDNQSSIHILADNINLDGQTEFITAIGRALDVSDLRVSDQVLFKPNDTNWGLTTKLIDGYTALLIGDTTANTRLWNTNNPIDPKIKLLLYAAQSTGGTLDVWSDDSHCRGTYSSDKHIFTYNSTNLANYGVQPSVSVYEARVLNGGAELTLKNSGENEDTDSSSASYSKNTPSILISCTEQNQPIVKIINPQDRRYYTEVKKDRIIVYSSTGTTTITGGQIVLSDGTNTKTITATT